MHLSDPHSTPSAKVYKSDIHGILPRLFASVGRLARLVSNVPTWAEFFLRQTVIAALVGHSLNSYNVRRSFSHGETQCMLHG